MKKFLMSLLILTAAVSTVFPQDDVNDTDVQKAQPPSADYKFPTAEKRFKRFVNETAGPRALLGAGISAGFQQIDNSPPEWRKNGTGYLRRFSSNLGINAIKSTTRYALSEALGQDPQYVKCECRGVSNRAAYALKSGFTARNRSGKTVFSPPKVVAPFVGSVTAVKVWYPERHTWKDGFRRGGYGLAFDVGFNLVREFVFKK